MENRLVKSQFIMPDLPTVPWRNEILEQKYRLILSYPLTIITGKLGSGKTTTLAYFLTASEYNNFYWYQIRQSTLRVNQFISNLIRAVTFKEETIRSQICNLAADLEEEKIEYKEAIKEFINLIIEELTGEVCMVIDNFEFVNCNYSILEAVDYLVELLPPFFHLIIVSRERVRFPSLSTWQVKDKVLPVQEKSFILGVQQIKRFFRTYYNYKLSSAEAEAIYRQTEGWMAAVNVIGKDFIHGGENEELITRQNKELLFDYLEREVMSNLLPRLENFLLSTAVLENLEVEVCNQLLNINHSQAILQELIARNLFVTQIEEGKFRYHNLFHQFLHQKAAQSRKLTDLDWRAKQIYSARGEIERVVHYSMQLDEEEKIVSLVTDNAEKWIEENQYQLLERCLTFLNRDYFNNHPSLYFYQGELYFQLEEYQLAIESYHQAEDYFKTQGDQQQLARLWFKLARGYFTLKSEKGLDYYKKLINHRSFLSAEQLEKVKLLQAEADFLQGQLKKAEQLISQEKKNFIEFGSQVQIAIHLLTGNIYQAQELCWQKLNSAAKKVRQGVKLGLLVSNQLLDLYLADKLKQGYLALREEEEFNLSRTQLELRLALILWEADYEQGAEFTCQELKAAENCDNDFLQAIFYLLSGINYCLQEKFAAAEDLLQLARDIFSQLGAELLLSSALLWLALLKYKQDKNSEFKQVITNALQLISRRECEYLFLQPTLLGFSDPLVFTPLLLAAREKGIAEKYTDKLLSKLNLSHLTRHPGYSLRVKGLGRFQLYRGRKEVTKEDWKRQKARDLFKILLANYNQQLVPRRKICSLLWPDKKSSAANQNFHVTLNSLRKVLDPKRNSRGQPVFIIRERNCYGLAPQLIYDVNRFETAVQRGQQAKKREIKVKYYQQAVELYQGDFLVNELSLEPVIKERQRLKNLFLNTAEDLVQYYYQRQDYQAAIELANKILHYDKYIESAYLYKMKSYHALGNKTKAVRTYQQCREILREELNIEPNGKIESYYQQLAL